MKIKIKKGVKIYRLTKYICCVCDEQAEYVLHKTRRQVHSLCRNCFIGYFRVKLTELFDLNRGKPFCQTEVKMGSEEDISFLANYVKGIPVVRCPGTVHGSERNRCSCKLHLGVVVTTFPTELEQELS